jgi:signal transduction histidine kinase
VLRNLFTPYFRSNGEDTGRRTGHGLGLYICAEIAKAHGGTLVASSLPEGGTTVTLTFPEQPAAQSAAAA